MTPHEVVGRLSMDMPLAPSDRIAGVGPMKDGEPVAALVEGVGHLSNVFG